MESTAGKLPQELLKKRLSPETFSKVNQDSVLQCWCPGLSFVFVYSFCFRERRRP
jgi:hypothetical protein